MLGVARSSVSRWVRDVELGEAEERALVERARLGPLVAARRKADVAREARRTWQQQGRRLVHERDASYVAGCMLYWAEGSKQRNSLKLVNADPELLATFVRFLRVHFEVADARLKVCCSLFADHATRQREVRGLLARAARAPEDVSAALDRQREYGGFEQPAWLD